MNKKLKLGGKFFALLDVKRGQHTLARQVKQGPIQVTLRGHIVEVYNQDAVSTEFRLEVTDVETES